MNFINVGNFYSITLLKQKNTTIMATVNKGGQARHDGQKNYDNSNQRNPDNVRNATRKHDYKEHDETLTNDQNYNLYNKKIEGDPEFADKKQNVDKHQNDYGNE